METVFLTTDDVQRARTVARIRNSLHVREGRPNASGFVGSHGANGNDLQAHFDGCLSEMAFARFIGQPWVPYREDFKNIEADVGSEYQVKSTRRIGGNLLVQPRLLVPDKKYVLVSIVSDKEHQISGWQYGHVIDNPRYFRSDMPKPCFCYPVKLLNRVFQVGVIQ